ncbi:hypothetical protein ACFL6I_03135 [candidate division KSB1 bacterium]
MRRFSCGVLLALTALVFRCGSDGADTEQTVKADLQVELEIGDPAPDFLLRRTTDNRSVSLDDILAEGPALLAFYPIAFSPG